MTSKPLAEYLAQKDLVERVRDRMYELWLELTDEELQKLIVVFLGDCIVYCALIALIMVACR